MSMGLVRIDHLHITGLDLAIGGDRIDSCGKTAFHNALSIATNVIMRSAGCSEAPRSTRK